MVSISTLRTFVNNGWTIANRRKICTEIGKNNFDEFAKLAKQVGMTGDTFEYEIVKEQFFNYNGVPAMCNINSWKRFFSRLKNETYNPKYAQLISGTKNGANWNSELYKEFKAYDANWSSWTENLAILNGKCNKEKLLHKDILFYKCKPLGKQETHYCGMRFDKKEEELYREIQKLNVGDIYSPKTFLWSTNSEEYAKSLAMTDITPNSVLFEITYLPEAKLIQFPFIIDDCNIVTEAICERTSKFVILSKCMEDKLLKVNMKFVQ